MENKISEFRNSQNPSICLFKSFEKDILGVREALFISLEKKSEIIGLAARRILQKKIQQSSALDVPVMFELFPWVIKDLIGLSYKKTHQISVNWLAIYLYVIFLDDHIDMKTEIKAEEFLGASVLAQKGLINLFKIVNGTKYEQIFSDSLFDAANFELVDVLEQTKIKNNKLGKTRTAAGKNKILIACAGALAASKEKKSEFVITLTNNLLLAIQFLDDLADFEDDFQRNNITVLLNCIAEDRETRFENIEREKIIAKLITSGSLLAVVKKIESSLASAIILINHNLDQKKKTSPTYHFFNSLYLEVVSFLDFLENVKNKFKDSAISIPKEIIEKTDKAIMKIYLHT